MDSSKLTESNWFIIDAPIKSESDDAFGHADVAENLRQMVSEPSGSRRMIGLFGGFGVGKSTVIELLDGKLRGNRENLRLVRMSAERHEPVGFHRAAVYAFAEALVDADEVKRAAAERILLPLKVAQTATFSDYTLSPLSIALDNVRQGLRTKWKRLLLWTAGGLLAALALTFLLSLLVPIDAWSRFGSFISSALTASGLMAGAVWFVKQLLGNLEPLTAPGSTTTQTARVEAADEQERAFAALAAEAQHRLVVAIDDIDRLSQDQILDALNAIRSFQLTCTAKDRPIFIVSLDESIVRRALAADMSAGSLPRGDEQEFLNRLFTLKQEMPIHERSDLKDYASTVLRQKAARAASALGPLSEDVVSVLIYEGVRDPRHVIRLLNAFVGNLRLAMGRENREGARSLGDGLVTKNPQVLARVTVLQTDFPEFFAAIARDGSLLNAASEALNLDFGEDSEVKLRNAGFDPKEPKQAPLLAYLSRTAGWVPEVPDIVPFLYLGQDRFGRSLGNQQAREIRSSLANNSPASLIRTAGSLKNADAEQNFQELAIDVLRELSGLERRNGIAAVAEAASQSQTLVTPAIAEVVSAALRDDPAITASVAGPVNLLSALKGTSAQQLASAVLDERASGEAPHIWSHRWALEPLVGGEVFEKWAAWRISSIETLSEVESWTAYDLSDGLIHLLLQQAARIAADQDEQPSDDLLTELDRLKEKLSQRLPLTDVAPLDALMSRSSDQPASVLGFMLASASELEPSKLATICAALVASSESMGAGETADSRLVALIVEHIERTAEHAASWTTGPDEDRRPSASHALDVLALWVTNGPASLSHVIQGLASLIKHGVAGHELAVETVFDTWLDDPDGTDLTGVSKRASFYALTPMLRDLDDPALKGLRDQFAAALEDSDTREAATSALPHFLSEAATTGWANRFVTSLISNTSPNVAETPTLLSASAVLVNTGKVSDANQTEVLNQLDLLLRYASSRPWALSAAALFIWSPSLVGAAASVFEGYVSDLDEPAFWSLFDQQHSSEDVDGTYLDEAAERANVDSDSLTLELIDRVEVLASLLDFEGAFRLALRSRSDAAVRAVASRIEDADVLADALLRAPALSNRETALAFASITADLSEEVYGAAVGKIFDNSMDIGTERNRAAWTFVTVPMTEDSRSALWTRIHHELLGSSAEATLASATLGAVGFDDEMDRLVSNHIADVMAIWIGQQSNAEVSAAIATAIRGGSKTRTNALSHWRRQPKNPGRLKAFSAARAALSR